MRIKQITIDGVKGEVRIIAERAGGARVMLHPDEGAAEFVCDMHPSDSDEERREAAVAAAKAIYGTAKASRFGGGGGPNCTGSMVHDVRCEIERIAGC